MTGLTHDPVEPIRIQRPDFEKYDVDQISAEYDEVDDSLYLYLVEGEIAPVNVLIDEEWDIYALADPETHELVGLNFEAFLSRVILEYPQFMMLGVIAGIPLERFNDAASRVRVDSSDNHESRSRIFSGSVRGQ